MRSAAALGRDLGLHAMAPATLAVCSALVIAARIHASPALPGLVCLGAVGGWLAVVDVRSRRLPDRVVLPAYLVVGPLLGAAAMFGGQPARIWHAVVGAGVLAGWYLLLALFGGLGFGDVKLAGLLGLALGWCGLRAWVLGATLPFLLAGVAALLGLALGRWTRSSELPLGPFMFAGTLLALLVAPPVS